LTYWLSPDVSVPCQPPSTSSTARVSTAFGTFRRSTSRSVSVYPAIDTDSPGVSRRSVELAYAREPAMPIASSTIAACTP